MAYKKPQMVAKSVAKKSYVAGCPTNSYKNNFDCYPDNSSCELGRQK